MHSYAYRLVVFLAFASILALLFVMLSEKSITMSTGQTLYFRGLGIGNRYDSIWNRQITRIEWQSPDGPCYLARSIGYPLYNFELVDDDIILCEGITIQADFNPNLNFNVAFDKNDGEMFDLCRVVESKNFDAAGNVLCEVIDGTGSVIFPRMINSGDIDRKCGYYEIRESRAQNVCFLEKTIQELRVGDLQSCKDERP